MIPAHGTHSRYSSKKHLCRCAECRKASVAYQRERRASRPDVRAKDLARSREWYKVIRAYIDKLKDKPCVDCGVKYPPYVMQFDHLEAGPKESKIAHLKTIARIDAEVAKCELVCGNCHAIRTHNRLML